MDAGRTTIPPLGPRRLWIVRGLSAASVGDAVLLALVAGATASGLYETVLNLLGLAGSGSRST